jgi:hypothetical protein
MKRLLLFTSMLYMSCINNTLVFEDNVPDDNIYSGCEQLLDTTHLDLYPIIPFTDEEMKTLDYRIKLERRQIPEDVLQKMTTKALFYQFALCELSRNMYMYNSAQSGFMAVATQLNMLPELLNRTDAGPVLLKLLQGVELAEISEVDCIHLYECMQRVIAQKEIINEMTKDDIHQYVSLMMLHQEIIKDLSEMNDNYSYPESLAAILYGLGNVMLRFEYEPFRLLMETDLGVSALMAGDNLRDKQTVLLINNCITVFSKLQN